MLIINNFQYFLCIYLYYSFQLIKYKLSYNEWDSFVYHILLWDSGNCCWSGHCLCFLRNYYQITSKPLQQHLLPFNSIARSSTIRSVTVDSLHIENSFLMTSKNVMKDHTPSLNFNAPTSFLPIIKWLSWIVSARTEQFLLHPMLSNGIWNKIKIMKYDLKKIKILLKWMC